MLAITTFSNFLKIDLSKMDNLYVKTLSTIGIIALVRSIMMMLKRRRLLKTYFQNKVVLITGASSGLGAALAEELYPLGAQLIICARRVDELNNVKTKLIQSNKSGCKEPGVVCMDVTLDEEKMKEKIDNITVKYGCIDVLINNAGISYRGETFSTSDDVFRKVMDVNFFGAVRLSNIVVNQMIKENQKKVNPQNKYSIVNVGSVQSLLVIPYRSAYAASKFALLAFADSMRAELHQHPNIEIINTFPGYINTNISLNAIRDTGAMNSVNDDDHMNAYSPNYVAKVIINSIIDRKKEVFISTFFHRFGTWVRFFTPDLYHFIMQRRGKSKSNAKYI